MGQRQGRFDIRRCLTRVHLAARVAELQDKFGDTFIAGAEISTILSGLYLLDTIVAGELRRHDHLVDGYFAAGEFIYGGGKNASDTIVLFNPDHGRLLRLRNPQRRDAQGQRRRSQRDDYSDAMGKVHRPRSRKPALTLSTLRLVAPWTLPKFLFLDDDLPGLKLKFRPARASGSRRPGNWAPSSTPS